MIWQNMSRIHRMASILTVLICLLGGCLAGCSQSPPARVQSRLSQTIHAIVVTSQGKVACSTPKLKAVVAVVNRVWRETPYEFSLAVEPYESDEWFNLVYRGRGTIEFLQERRGELPAGTIPVLVVNSLEDPTNPGIMGAGYEDIGIIMENVPVFTNFVLSHELGHYYGLPHAFDEEREALRGIYDTPRIENLLCMEHNIMANCPQTNILLQTFSADQLQYLRSNVDR